MAFHVLVSFLTAASAFLTAGTFSVADAFPAEEIVFFERDIRPVLAEQCFACHGSKKQHAQLRLDSRAAILRGSDAGQVVDPARPAASRLIRVLRHEGDIKMPKKRPQLLPDQIAAFEKWIQLDLPWPDDPQPNAASHPYDMDFIRAKAAAHWAFQPLRKPAVPPGEEHPIDAFIAQKLAAHGLGFSPPADRNTLLRRLSYVITGLMPSPEHLRAFEADPRPEVVTESIDSLLASPRYGERWARHWLDLARYADTKGYVFQEDRNYPYAYTYRDWVIQSLNEDMPYDRFVQLQIAADRITDKRQSDLAAMGFLTVGRRFLNKVHDIYDDQIDVMSRSLMGLTVACARCHDHKFDPVDMKDYYALFGVLDSSEAPARLPQIGEAPDTPEAKMYQAELEKKARHVHQFLQEKIQGYKIPEDVTAIKKSVEKHLKERPQKNEFRKRFKQFLEYEAKSEHAPPRAMVLVDRERPRPGRVYLRGNMHRPGETVMRRFIKFLDADKNPPAFDPASSGRLDLAQAMTDSTNPLTARVIVNRVWGYHFGQGLVQTPSDFGLRSEPPSHPGLLDWLALDLIEHDWSLKHLHRRILTSKTFQQSSFSRQRVKEHKAQLMDPDNRLYWRTNPRRRDFESLRDCLLAAADDLDLTMGGRSRKLETVNSTRRRAVYGFIERQNLPGLFRTFDFAGPDSHSPKRYETTTPRQALYLMNHPFVLDRARRLASNTPQPEDLFRAILRRDPTSKELQFSENFLSGGISTPTWSYGYGGYKAETGVQFTPYPAFVQNTWQGGPKRPDAKLGWSLITPDGGHPGTHGFEAIRRWTAPEDLTVSLSGTLDLVNQKSDGLRAWVVAGGHRVLGEWHLASAEKKETRLENVALTEGETLDFIVGCGQQNNVSYDLFRWAPVIKSGSLVWDARSEFSARPLSRAAQLAQALLVSNEFLFVD